MDLFEHGNAVRGSWLPAMNDEPKVRIYRRAATLTPKPTLTQRAQNTSPLMSDSPRQTPPLPHTHRNPDQDEHRPVHPIAKPGPSSYGMHMNVDSNPPMREVNKNLTTMAIAGNRFPITSALHYLTPNRHLHRHYKCAGCRTTRRSTYHFMASNITNTPNLHPSRSRKKSHS